jgi:hypothetical protein
MINPVALGAALAVLASAIAPVAPVPPVPPVPRVPMTELTQIPSTLDWRVDAAHEDQAAGMVDFEIGYHTEHSSMMMGESTPLASLNGLSVQALQAGGNVAFTLHRDAGDLRCTGTARVAVQPAAASAGPTPCSSSSWPCTTWAWPMSTS